MQANPFLILFQGFVCKKISDILHQADIQDTVSLFFFVFLFSPEVVHSCTV